MKYPACSDKIKKYFDSLTDYADKALAVAGEARKKGLDPCDEVEIKLAEDVAARVEGLVGPKGVAQVIRDLEKTGIDRKTVACEIVKKIARGELIQGDKQKLLDQAVRVGVGVLTEGVLVAPTEGIGKICIAKNADGSERVDVYYAGPIRSAGGTIAALSVVMADIARKELNLGEFRPTESEIERYVEEIDLYDRRCARLQYRPKDEDIRTIVKNIPICINGEPTNPVELSVHRDTHGVSTNRVRGGIALVIGEGIAQKAPKVLKYTKKINLDGWDWVENIVKVKKKEKNVEIKPIWTYLNELVAGRPVIAYPGYKGGFRIRYGRSPMAGIMSRAFHPATLEITNGFLALGTQGKIERPGKGCIMTLCDDCEPPVVRLKDGRVLKLETREQAQELDDKIDQVLFVGDMLVPIGDMIKSGHPIVPDAWCEEWWHEILKSKELNDKQLEGWELVKFSLNNSLPLAPKLTKAWNDLDETEIEQLKDVLKQFEGQEIDNLELENNQNIKDILEKLYVLHHIEKEKTIELEKQNARIFLDDHPSVLLVALGLWKPNDGKNKKENEGSLKLINQLSPIEIKPWCSLYIGLRMGRPEKAKIREMRPAIHSLFPIGKLDRMRNIAATAQQLETNGKSLYIEIAKRKCEKCGQETIFSKCDLCNSKTVASKEKFERKPVNLYMLWKKAYTNLNVQPPKSVKGVIGMMTASKIPERLEKGILRVQHGIYVYKDGTSRFDATDVPITHFKPKDIQTSVEKLKELGYNKDWQGNPLENDDQVIEIFPQDLIINEHGVDFMINTGNFVDDLLVKFYGMKPFYNFKKGEDVYGHMVIGLAPHISAGTLARVIGQTKIRGTLGHPYYHTAKRRNCFHKDEFVTVYNDEWQTLTFEDLYNKIENNIKTDDFGTLTKKMKKYQTLSYNTKTKQFEIKEITHVSKHKPKPMVKIKTKNGLEIITTQDHPFVSREMNKIKAEEITEVLTPKIIKINENDIQEFDLKKYSKEVMIKINENIIEPKTYKKLSEKLNINYKTFTNYVYIKSYPLELLHKLNKTIPRKVKISAKRDNLNVKQFIKNDKYLLFLIGFYIAEGHMKKQQKLSYTVNFCSVRKDIRVKIAKTIEKVFGIKPSINKNTISISSRIIYNFFENLNIGKNAQNKNIPNFVMSLPLNKVKHLLKGYFYGDGSVSLGSTLEVNATSINRKLLYQTSWLLQRFGIKNSISKSNRMINSKLILDFYGKPKELTSYKIRMYSDFAEQYINKIGFAYYKQENALNKLKLWQKKKRKNRATSINNCYIENVKTKENVKAQESYSITVKDNHTLIASNILTYNCDGDEDAIILLMDAFLNFSMMFKPEIRGGSMDMPIVLTTILNPKEVDDEVHVMEKNSSYPLSFYEAAENYDLNLEGIILVEQTLGTPAQYEGFGFTHNIKDMNNGPTTTKYIKFKSMRDKLMAQLVVQERIRAVDNRAAAEKVILSHFIPDLYGNLRGFSQQTVRCVQCNEKFRRAPLKGKCTKCGGKIVLTIHAGGVKKYLNLSKEICTRYDLPDYLKQRIMLLEKDIANIFDDELKEQLSISDFI